MKLPRVSASCGMCEEIPWFFRKMRIKSLVVLWSIIALEVPRVKQVDHRFKKKRQVSQLSNFAATSSVAWACLRGIKRAEALVCS
jgi:hypothetical protein